MKNDSIAILIHSLCIWDSGVMGLFKPEWLIAVRNNQVSPNSFLVAGQESQKEVDERMYNLKKALPQEISDEQSDTGAADGSKNLIFEAMAFVYISVQNSEEVRVALDQLPRDATDILDILKAEQAPLDLWLIIAEWVLAIFQAEKFMRKLLNLLDQVVVVIYFMVKNGRKFAFVRFLRVQDVLKLVETMSSTWYGSYHLYACLAKYDRRGTNDHRSDQSHARPQPRSDPIQPRPHAHQHVQNTVSFAVALQNGRKTEATQTQAKAPRMQQPKKAAHPTPTQTHAADIIQLEHIDMLSIPDSATIVLGKFVKLSLIDKIQEICLKEGFKGVEVTYIGGSWVWLEFNTRNACVRFKQCDLLKTYFSQLQNLSRQFTVDDKVVWIEISGMPLGSWSASAFKKVAATWGEVVFLDSSYGGVICNGRVCVRVPRSKEISGERMVSLEGIKNVIKVRELGCWMPNLSETIDHALEDSEANMGGALSDEEREDSNSVGGSDSVEEGEVVMSDDGFNYEKVGKYSENREEQESMRKHSSAKSSRWDDEVEEEERVHASAAAPAPSLVREEPLQSTATPSRAFTKFWRSGAVDECNQTLIRGGSTGTEVAERMKRFIEIGECLGYDMQGIQETRVPKVYLFELRSMWGNFSFDFALSSARGLSGGLISIWDPAAFHKSNIVCMENVLIVEGTWIFANFHCFMINVYALQADVDKRALWDKISLFMANNAGEYIVFGDFNDVRHRDERLRCAFSQREAAVFNEFIGTSSLVEVSLGGFAFTRVSSNGEKMCKLDRFLITEGVGRVFSGIGSMAFTSTISDHRPILLTEVLEDYGSHPFRFFTSWMSEPTFEEEMKNSWEKPIASVDKGAAFVFKDKLKRLKVDVKAWWVGAKKQQISLKLEMTEKLKNIDSTIDAGGVTDELLQERTQVREVLGKLKKKEIEDLAHKAKVKWAIVGDENSKYFHGILNKKRRQLSIKGVKVEGEWVTEAKGVKKVPKKVGGWSAPPTREEVKEAVWACGSEKAPRPDGFNFSLIKRFWGVMAVDVFAFVEEFFWKSFISFWCKEQSAFIKIIAKVLAIRLAAVIDSVVSKEQSAFIKGRQILDGPLVVNEVINWYKKKKKLKLLKIDFEKAYDSVSWSFLDQVMGCLKFPTRWRGWIRACLHSSRSSVLVNESPSKEFRLYRGLRQGDPLSPFLFILVMEGLHVAMKDAMAAGFFKPTCLSLNLAKSNLYGVGVGSQEVEVLARIVGCRADKFPFVYLGLPVGENMARVKGWKRLEEKFTKRLSRGKVSVLSIGGRSVLLKSVLGALGVYFFSMFVMPVTLAKKLEAIRSRFFWGGSESKRKIAWVNWEAVLASKDIGGLNVGSLVSFNLALVMKWKWLFFTSTDNIWVTVIRFLYGHNGGFFSTRCQASGFSPWARILATNAKLREKDVLQEEVMERRVGDGKKMRFWTDVWVGNISLSTKFPRLFKRDCVPDCLVADRWAEDGWAFSWSRPITGGVAFGQLQEMVDLLREVRCSRDPDGWSWKIASDGMFSVASTRGWIDRQVLRSSNFKTRWCKYIPQKVNIFIWRLCWRRLATRLALLHRGVGIESVAYPLCGEEEEELAHLFFRCQVASALWERVFRWVQVQPYVGDDLMELLSWCDAPGSRLVCV
ncbi:hypothetical protein LXL04_019893 [Taraxacum kok-saghyz]